MKILLPVKFVMIFLIVCSIARAQSLSPVVISSLGGYYSNATASLSFTVAESSMVRTFSTSGNMLTQGFQQPYSMLVNISEIEETNGEILIFPNPTANFVTIRCVESKSTLFSVRIFNLSGQIILKWENNQNNPLSEWTGDLRGHSSGLYIIEVIRNNKSGIETIDYSKINLQY